MRGVTSSYHVRWERVEVLAGGNKDETRDWDRREWRREERAGNERKLVDKSEC